MSLFVPDASVILAFFLKEQEKGDKAKDLFSDVNQGTHNIILPSIWFYEVGNILGRINSSEAKKYRESLCFYREHFFQTIEIDEAVSATAFDLMKRYQTASFYDTVYHALAINKNATFLTADKKYFDITKQEGHIEYF